MYLIHEKELFNAFECLKADINHESAKKIVLINGTFGSGKSFFLKSLLPALLEENLVDYIFKADFDTNAKFTIDILQSLAQNSYYIESESLPAFSNNESSFINEQFTSTLSTLRNKDTYLFEKIYEREYLKDNYQFHLSTNETEEDLSNEAICNSIEALYPNQDKYKTFFSNPTKVALESLIVDLMTVLFAGQTEFPIPKKKYKIVMVIDGYDKQSWTVQNWILEKLLPCLDNLKFGDFVSYDTSFIDAEVKLSDFFDFRFVFSFRENLLQGRLKEAWETHSDQLKNITLNPASDLVMQSFFHSEGIDKSDYDALAKNTFGIPYIFNLKVEYKKVGDSEIDNISLVYHLAGQKILSDFEEQQSDWIRCTAFLDEFDARGLEFFQIIGQKSKIAFSFMQFLSDIYIHKGDKLQLRHELKELISKATLFDSPSSSKGYSKIAEQYYELAPLIDKYNETDFNILCELAYFDWFEKDFILEKAFSDKLEAINVLINNRPDLFELNSNMLRINNDLACKLNTLNQILDSDLYSNKIAYIAEIETEFQKSLQDKLTKLGNKKKEASESLSLVRDQLDDALNAIANTQKPQGRNLYKKNTKLRIEPNTKYTKYLALTAVLVVLGIKPELILGIVFESDATFDIASKMFYILAALMSAFIGIDYFSGKTKVKRQTPQSATSNSPLTDEEKKIEELKHKEIFLKNELHKFDNQINTVSTQLGMSISRICDK